MLTRLLHACGLYLGPKKQLMPPQADNPDGFWEHLGFVALNDELLNGNHGQPLRLIIPVKYGIKNLKRIGSINFSNTRPRDYWAEQGYDYYSGL